MPLVYEKYHAHIEATSLLSMVRDEIILQNYEAIFATKIVSDGDTRDGLKFIRR